MYTRVKFGTDLKKRLSKGQGIIEIGEWAYDIFLDHCDENDVVFLKLLLTINKMELGPEFAFTYEELIRIANDLIVGKDVRL